MNITVLSVSDDPEITLPASPIIVEDGTLSIHGLSIYDADISRPDDKAFSFTMWLEASAGKISLDSVNVSPLDPLKSWGEPLVTLLSG